MKQRFATTLNVFRNETAFARLYIVPWTAAGTSPVMLAVRLPISCTTYVDVYYYYYYYYYINLQQASVYDNWFPVASFAVNR